MKIIPLAADSMGTRSMATYVETRDRRILIDPGAALNPSLHGLPPHPLEIWCLKKHRKRILLYAHSSEIIIITHYHSGHFIPDNPDIYKKKLLMIKNPNRHISPAQRKRVFDFLKMIKGLPHDIMYVDGRTFRFGKTQITFSKPFLHTSGDDQDFAIQVAVQENMKTFLHTSDILGLSQKQSLDFILGHKPDMLYLDGPLLSSTAETRKSAAQMEQGIRLILENTPVHTIILDHHLLRDPRWREIIARISQSIRDRMVQIQTAAEFRGEENIFLETRRKQLYENDPPKK
jgi:predicted metallo-beta-lactamase superfamily hydrolase